MPKVKTSRAAAKRFKVSGSGKLIRNKAYKSHILTKKSEKRHRDRQHELEGHEEDPAVFIIGLDVKKEEARWQE